MTLVFRLEKEGVQMHVIGEFDFASAQSNLTALFKEGVYRQCNYRPLSQRHLDQYDTGCLTLQLREILKLQPGTKRIDFLERARICMVIFCAHVIRGLNGVTGPINVHAQGYLIDESVSFDVVDKKVFKPIPVETLLDHDVKLMRAAQKAYEAGNLEEFTRIFSIEMPLLSPFASEDRVITQMTAEKIAEKSQGTFIVNALGLSTILSDLKNRGFVVTQITL